MPNSFSIVYNEIKYMFKSKIIILLILVSCVMLAIGINSLNMTNDFNLFNIRKTSSTISFNSVKFGATISSLLFALFIVLSLDKDKRKRSRTIIESNIDYLNIIKARIFSIVFYAIITTIIGMIVVMIVQKFIYCIPIDISYYLFNYFVIFFPTLFFSILMISGFYLLTESLDISVITFGVIFIKSLTSNNYLLTWVRTNIEIVSDFAGIEPVGNTIVYNRILWLLISISIFFIGLMFQRKYECGLGSSFLINMKNKGLFTLTILMIFGSGFIYAKEPYTMELMDGFDIFIDENIYLDGIYPEIKFDSENGEMNAHVSYSLINNGSNIIKFNINDGLEINSIKVNGKETAYHKVKKKNIVKVSIPNVEKINIEIFYDGKVKCDKNGVGRSMPGYIAKDSIYLLEVSNWIFRPLVVKGDIIDISGYYIAPDYLTMVVPGKLIDVETSNGNKKWIFEYKSHTADMGAFAARYMKTQIEVEDVIVEFYYIPKHEEYVNNMKIVEHIKCMMEYYIENIGEYFSDEYPLKIVEVSIYKRGGHSSENVITFAENTINRDNSLYSILNKNADIDDFRKVDIYANDLNLIAHEMAHQWWGTGVNVVEDIPWSSEGLANYFSYKYIQKKFGDMISSSVLLIPWKNRVDELQNYYYIKHDDMKEKLNEKFAKSLEMEKRKAEIYYLMPLKLLKGEEIQGEKAFLEGIQKVYRRYLLNDLPYDEFLQEMNLTKGAIDID